MRRTLTGCGLWLALAIVAGPLAAQDQKEQALVLGEQMSEYVQGLAKEEDKATAKTNLHAYWGYIQQLVGSYAEDEKAAGRIDAMWMAARVSIYGDSPEPDAEAEGDDLKALLKTAEDKLALGDYFVADVYSTHVLNRINAGAEADASLKADAEAFQKKLIDNLIAMLPEVAKQLPDLTQQANKFRTAMQMDKSHADEFEKQTVKLFSELAAIQEKVKAFGDGSCDPNMLKAVAEQMGNSPQGRQGAQVIGRFYGAGAWLLLGPLTIKSYVKDLLAPAYLKRAEDKIAQGEELIAKVAEPTESNAAGVLDDAAAAGMFGGWAEEPLTKAEGYGAEEAAVAGIRQRIEALEKKAYEIREKAMPYVRVPAAGYKGKDAAELKKTLTEVYDSYGDKALRLEIASAEWTEHEAIWIDSDGVIRYRCWRSIHCWVVVADEKDPKKAYVLYVRFEANAVSGGWGQPFHGTESTWSPMLRENVDK